MLPHILELRFLLTSQSQAHLSLQVLTNMRCYRHWEPPGGNLATFCCQGSEWPREEKENDSNLRTGLRMKAKYPEEIVMHEEKL